MSQPIRYNVGMRNEMHPSGLGESFAWVYPSPEGKYVMHYEYAALASENERLRSDIARLKIVKGYEHYVADLVQRLSDQNERLRKAVEAALDHFETGFTAEYRVVEACKVALHSGPETPPAH